MNPFLEIGFILAIATLVAIVMQSLRLPLLLGHIITGVVVGPVLFDIIQSRETLEIFSQLGITALLFIVGLGLNPSVIREVGKVAFFTGLGQIVFTTLFGFLIASALGYSWLSALCIAIALTLSSTIIVMKLLSDRGDAGKLYGKIAMGFLLIQDLVATIILVLVSSLADVPDLKTAAILVAAKSLGVVCVLILMGKFILPRLTRLFALSQEFLFLFTIGWGVGLAALFHLLGLSVEIGALAAGITLAASPYRYEINAKMKLVRDFFIVMFFVLLGSQLTWSGIGPQWLSASIFSVFILVGNPLIVIAIMGALGYTKKTSFFAGLTVAQISEFSLILLLILLEKGFVDSSVVSLLTAVGIVTMTGSTFMIMNADALYAWLAPVLGIFERAHPLRDRSVKERYEVILFGCHRVGQDLLSTFQKRKLKYLVVDFDPQIIERLETQGIACRYGDAHDNELIEELDLQRVKLIISTIPDVETNMFLLQKAKKINPTATIILSAHTLEQALALYDEGAAYVLLPHFLGGNYAAMLLERHGHNRRKFASERKLHLEHIEKRLAKI